MKKKLAILATALTASLLIGCSTVSGAAYGAGIGYILGDAELGATVGATAGLVKDIWK